MEMPSLLGRLWLWNPCLSSGARTGRGAVGTTPSCLTTAASPPRGQHTSEPFGAEEPEQEGQTWGSPQTRQDLCPSALGQLDTDQRSAGEGPEQRPPLPGRDFTSQLGGCSPLLISTSNASTWLEMAEQPYAEQQQI